MPPETARDAGPAPLPDAAPAAGGAQCRNCGAVLRGPFCHRCGQEDRDPRGTLPHLLGEWAGNLLAVDGRLWRTLAPLFASPGFLTCEYAAGRRVRYVPPLRLYFFASVLLFLALGWSGPQMVHMQFDEAERGEALAAAEEEGGLAAWVGASMARLSRYDDDQINRIYRERLAQSVILLVVAFAAFGRLLFPRPHRLFLHHLVFSTHVHAAVFLAVVAGLGVDALLPPDEPWALALLVFAGGPAYLFLALRRVHGRGILGTGWRMAALLALHGIALVLTFLGTLLVAGALA